MHTGPDFGRLDQRNPGTRAGVHQRRGVGEFEPIRHADNIVGRPCDALGVAALLGPLGDKANSIARREPANICADRSDDAGAIAAGNLGKGNGKQILQLTVA